MADLRMQARRTAEYEAELIWKTPSGEKRFENCKAVDFSDAPILFSARNPPTSPRSRRSATARGIEALIWSACSFSPKPPPGLTTPRRPTITKFCACLNPPTKSQSPASTPPWQKDFTPITPRPRIPTPSSASTRHGEFCPIPISGLVTTKNSPRCPPGLASACAPANFLRA